MLHNLTMRVLIISDIHGNLAALESVLAAAAGQYDVAWCLGDVVGYGPKPNECVELVREHAALCVMGNHDWAVLGRPGINVDDFNPQARQAVLWTREQLTAEKLAKVRQLNELALDRGQKLSQMSLAWVLRDGRVTSALIGASKTSQIDDAVGMLANTEFSEAEIKIIEDILV